MHTRSLLELGAAYALEGVFVWRDGPPSPFQHTVALRVPDTPTCFLIEPTSATTPRFLHFLLVGACTGFGVAVDDERAQADDGQR